MMKWLDQVEKMRMQEKSHATTKKIAESDRPGHLLCLIMRPSDMFQCARGLRR